MLCGIVLCTVAPALAQLQPFVLPWNDASTGITDLQSWQPRMAGADGWVTVDDNSHYVVGGERIRFLGVNIGAGAAFPSHALADVHAARLARFGVNNVRFHHLEAPWASNDVLIDYASGSSRQFSAARLERLQYFVAALAAKGVYSNINLLVSREFKATDGLGLEITQLGWKDQHILGFFSDAALALHQEHATKLLTAPNPHRGGVPFAQDPAVAIVEVMNENGLVQKWYERVLDTMPAAYRAQLAARWNAWLLARHANTAAMLTAWGAVNESLGPNRLTNGNFDAGTTGWNGEQHDVAVATFTRTTEFTGGGSSLRINVTTPGSASWHVQFNQSGIPLVAGQVYTVSFWIRASAADVPFSANISKAYPDWSTLAPGRSGTAGTSWTQVTWTFQAGVSDTNARLNFGGFGNRVSTVWIADVRFNPGGQIGGLPAGVSLEAGTVPNVTRTPGTLAPTAAQQRDWMDCLRTLETDYWTTMYQHVKTTLGYQGLVWGTIISNSPPNTQAVFDAMDSHSYWQHPQFPSGDWDPVNWTVDNVSMVNDTAGGTLGGLARQRVHGRPHNITEYQHSSPNTYSSEAPLLVAAYGALQDWDGIWLFDYTTVGASDAGRIDGYFDQAQHPSKMANTLLAAALFRRGDVARARKNYVMPFTPAREVDVLNTQGNAWSVGDGSHLGVPASLALVSRLSLTIGVDATGLTAPPAAPAGPVRVSDTGELRWDNSRTTKGVVTIDTARTKAVIGFIDGRSFDLGGVVLAPGTTRQDWCTLGVTLIEGESFSHAGGGRALIVATGDIENTGQIWTSSARNSVRNNWGTAPTLVEVVPATITLPVAASRVQGWALDGAGQPAAALTVVDVGGRARITLGTAGATLWYELAIAPGVPFAPVVLEQPMSHAGAAGSATTLRAGIDGFPAPVLQWYRNGQPIAGAVGSSHVIDALGAGNVGTHHLVAQSSAGSVQTRAVQVALTAGGGSGPAAERLINVSTRSQTLGGSGVMIGGFVVTGTQPRELLIRGVGPGLAAFGVTGVLSDPRLDLFRSGDQVPWLSNNDWDPVAMGDLFTQVGAFPLTNPRETCLRVSLAPGPYTAHLAGVGGAEGVALLEIYDAGGGDGRIVNLATRGHAGQGGEGLIVGFVINGSAPKRVLIRGVGPALSAFGVVGAVADPRLVLNRIDNAGSILLRTNDDWEETDGAAIVTAAQTAGAFPLPLAGNDAALLVWLEPGLFTARAEAKGAAGVGLVEVYELE